MEQRKTSTKIAGIDIAKAHDPRKLHPFLTLAQHHALFPSDKRRAVCPHFCDGHSDFTGEE